MKRVTSHPETVTASTKNPNLSGREAASAMLALRRCAVASITKRCVLHLTLAQPST